jgi:hypothetical protein
VTQPVPDQFQLPIVFRNDSIEVGGQTLPGLVETEVGVRVESLGGGPLYHVTVTFLTEIEPVVDPSADLVCAVEGDRTYELRQCGTAEKAEDLRRTEDRRRSEGASQC